MPSCRTAKDMTWSLWAVKLLTTTPVLVFHRRIFESQLPLTNDPFGRTAKQLTELLWPVKILIVSPVDVFHKRIVLS